MLVWLPYIVFFIIENTNNVIITSNYSHIVNQNKNLFLFLYYLNVFSLTIVRAQCMSKQSLETGLILERYTRILPLKLTNMLQFKLKWQTESYTLNKVPLNLNLTFVYDFRVHCLTAEVYGTRVICGSSVYLPITV